MPVSTTKPSRRFPRSLPRIFPAPLIFKDEDSNIFIKVTRESLSFFNSDTGEKLKSINEDATNFYQEIRDLLDNAKYEIPKNEEQLKIIEGKKWNKMIEK